METMEMICICCPMGCNMSVLLEDGNIADVSGSSCKRGKEYAVSECILPKRTLTTTVRVCKGNLPVVSVKTNRDIPKSSLMACMEAVKEVKVDAPVSIGDVIVYNISGTGADLIATMNVSYTE